MLIRRGWVKLRLVTTLRSLEPVFFPGKTLEKIWAPVRVKSEPFYHDSNSLHMEYSFFYHDSNSLHLEHSSFYHDSNSLHMEYSFFYHDSNSLHLEYSFFYHDSNSLHL